MIALSDREPVEVEPAHVLELDGIAHRFGSRWVLRGCSLRLERGDVVAVVGGNGTGKTTLLRIIATLLRPTRGGARVLGHDLRTDPGTVRELVGLMGYSAALYEDLTAAENLRFAEQMRGRRSDPSTVARTLDEVGLLTHGDSRVRDFSTGMRRRVALARILLAPPALFLIDEPYSALDEEGIELVNSVIRQTKARGGAVLMATHDLSRAAGVVDRTVRLRSGTIEQIVADPAPSLPAAWTPPSADEDSSWR
jgi:heme exporter protein A